MKNHMPHRYFSGYMILFVFILLSSCSNEKNSNDPTGSDDPVYIEVNTKSVIGSVIDGVTISKMRMIVAEQGSEIIFQNLTTLQENATGDGFLVDVRPGSYKIYLIANETSAMATALSSMQSLQQVRNYVVTSADYNIYTEANITLFAENAIKVKENPANTSQGLVSIDNGATWATFYSAALKRIMAKVSLKLKTTNATDDIKVAQVWMMHMPNHFYLGNIPYAELISEYENKQATLLVSVPYKLTSASQNMFTNFFIRENRFIPVANRDMATYLLVAVSFNTVTNLYTIPLGTPQGGVPSAPIVDYNIYKGNHYVVEGIIDQRGEFDNEFTINVLPWNKVSGDVGFNESIQFSANWAGGTNISQGMAYVYYNQYVEYQFVLNEPAGAIWAASLTNGNQFEFDTTNGAVSQGITNAGYTYKIRIKPRQLQTVPGVKTDFYITVGGEEIDLNGAATGKRYTINQIPQ